MTITSQDIQRFAGKPEEETEPEPVGLPEALKQLLERYKPAVEPEK